MGLAASHRGCDRSVRALGRTAPRLRNNRARTRCSDGASDTGALPPSATPPALRRTGGCRARTPLARTIGRRARGNRTPLRTRRYRDVDRASRSGHAANAQSHRSREWLKWLESLKWGRSSDAGLVWGRAARFCHSFAVFSKEYAAAPGRKHLAARRLALGCVIFWAGWGCMAAQGRLIDPPTCRTVHSGTSVAVTNGSPLPSKPSAPSSARAIAWVCRLR